MTAESDLPLSDRVLDAPAVPTATGPVRAVMVLDRAGHLRHGAFDDHRKRTGRLHCGD